MSIKTLSAPLQAAADPVRLRVLSLLRAGETCVGDLVAALGLPQPTVSRHLAVLRSAGLVDVRRDGRWAHYSLRTPADPFHAALLECVARGAERSRHLAQDADRLERLRKDGSCCAPSPTPTPLASTPLASTR